MREIVIVGRPNSGKTMFTLNFAAFLGSKKIDVTFRTHDDLVTCKHYTIDQAKKDLCGMSANKTKSMQSIILKTVIGKSNVNFKLNDTCGITEQIHPDENIRRGMAQTIGLIRCADFIFHVFDLSSLSQESKNNIDQEIYHYGTIRNSYVLLANKIDLSGAKDNLIKIHHLFPQASIIPISALFSSGFKEVRACVSRNI